MPNANGLNYSCTNSKLTDGTGSTSALARAITNTARNVVSDELFEIIVSINLPVGITCNPKAPCFKLCYARKGHYIFPNVQKVRMENWKLWRENPEDYKRGAMAVAKHVHHVRWHDSGDIPDREYLEMMVFVAENNPGTRFLAFTKQYDIVNEYLNDHNGYLPGNLCIVFSKWDGFYFDNPWNLPVAYVRLNAGNIEPIPESAFECSKFCGACVFGKTCCWYLKRGQSVVSNQH